MVLVIRTLTSVQVQKLDDIAFRVCVSENTY